MVFFREFFLMSQKSRKWIFSEQNVVYKMCRYRSFFSLKNQLVFFPLHCNLLVADLGENLPETLFNRGK